MYLIFKRFLDISLSIFLFVILSPLFILISFVLLIKVKGSPFYVQERGLAIDKRRFKLYKFKTLITSKLKNDNDLTLPILTKPQYEVYLIPFGKFLRKTGLDELPQLINILKGDMSFIGPRPLSIEDLNMIKQKFPDFYEQRSNIKTPVGLSGLWQVNKNYKLDVDNLIELDRKYDENISLALDISLLFKSLKIVLFAKHQDSIINENESLPIKEYSPIYDD